MQFDFRILDEAGDLRSKKVLLAIDTNVPVDSQGKVSDDFRLQRVLPTLRYLNKSGAKVLILGHLADKNSETLSLTPIFEYLKNIFPLKIAENLSEAKEMLEVSGEGDFVMLENIRRFDGETKCDDAFSKELASLGEIYVNDTFSVSHRMHSSIVGLPKFLPSFAGFLFRDEVIRLSKAFAPSKPFLFVLAGAKFETKFPLVQKFLGLAEFVFIGGGLANDLFKAKGFEIGVSKHSAKDLGFREMVNNPKILLPTDVVVEKDGVRSIKKADSVLADERIVDAGPLSIDNLRKVIQDSKFVLWNGTLGICEEGFSEGSDGLAQAISESGAESILGGGDTVGEIEKIGLTSKFHFVSTGGGAMLDFLAKETLPGIEALEESAKNFKI